MRYVTFALGFVFGVLVRPVELQATIYYPKTSYAQGLDARRRARLTWKTGP